MEEWLKDLALYAEGLAEGGEKLAPVVRRAAVVVQSIVGDVDTCWKALEPIRQWFRSS